MSLSLSFLRLFTSSKNFLFVRDLSLTLCTSNTFINNRFFCISHLSSKKPSNVLYIFSDSSIYQKSISYLQQNSFLRFVTFFRLIHRGITFLLNFIIDFHARFSLIDSKLFFNRFLDKLCSISFIDFTIYYHARVFLDT